MCDSASYANAIFCLNLKKKKYVDKSKQQQQQSAAFFGQT